MDSIPQFGNCLLAILHQLRVGDDDARKLAEGFASFDAQALTSLGVGEAICRIDRADHDFNLGL